MRRRPRGPLTRPEHEGTDGHQGSATSPPAEKDRHNHKTRSGPTAKRAGLPFSTRRKQAVPIATRTLTLLSAAMQRCFDKHLTKRKNFVAVPTEAPIVGQISSLRCQTALPVHIGAKCFS